MDFIQAIIDAVNKMIELIKQFVKTIRDINDGKNMGEETPDEGTENE